MNCKIKYPMFLCLILSIFYISSAYGDSSSLVYAEPKNRFVSLDAELSLEYRSDRLREMQNTETTNIRNLSLLVSLFENEDSKFVFEILGEENRVGDLNVNVGELYYHTSLSLFKDKDSTFNVGVLKLGYGLLNDRDGLFAVLPSYYAYLYDLPRGLDTGVEMSTQVFIPQLNFSASIFAGKNLRQTDSKNREIEVVPHHFKLSYEANSHSHLALNYFSRKYEAQPMVSGLGLEYQHIGLANFFGINLDIDFEVWSITAAMNSIQNNGMAGLVAPRITYKKLFFQPYFSVERWSQGDTPSSTETFFTGKLGYLFNKNIQFVLEQTQIKNSNFDMYKENSLQARVVSQWNF